MLSCHLKSQAEHEVTVAMTLAVLQRVMCPLGSHQITMTTLLDSKVGLKVMGRGVKSLQ